MKHLILILALTSISAMAEPRFNPISGEYENADPDEVLTYDPIEDQWSYEDEDADLEYSPLYEEDDQWQYGDGEEDE